MPFDHSFLSGGIDFCAFLNKSFYQHSLLYQSMLLGGVGCCMSNLFFYHPALLCHSIRLEKSTLPLFTPLGGDWFYISIYIHIHFFQESLLSSFMPLSFQTLENAIRPFISFCREWFLCIFQKLLLSLFIALSTHAFGRGWMLHVNSFFSILHCSVIPYY